MSNFDILAEEKGYTSPTPARRRKLITSRTAKSPASTSKYHDTLIPRYRDTSIPLTGGLNLKVSVQVEPNAKRPADFYVELMSIRDIYEKRRDATPGRQRSDEEWRDAKVRCLELIVPGTFNGPRGNATLQTRTLLWVDVDPQDPTKGPTPDDVAAWAERLGIACAVLPSPSNRRDGGPCRFHMVMVFETPVSGEVATAYVQWVYGEHGNNMGKDSLSPARGYFNGRMAGVPFDEDVRLVDGLPVDKVVPWTKIEPLVGMAKQTATAPQKTTPAMVCTSWPPKFVDPDPFCDVFNEKEKSALVAIPGFIWNDRNWWINLGMAIKEIAESRVVIEGSEALAVGLAMFKAVSQRCSDPGKYDETACEDKWRGFGKHAIKRLRSKFIFETAETYGHWASDPDVSEMNQKLAVVRIGGKARIAYLDTPEVEFGTERDLHIFYANKIRFVEKGDKSVPCPLSRIWISDKQRREHQGIRFDPSAPPGGVGGGPLNPWRGWAATPLSDEPALFIRHVWEVIADGDEEIANYVFDWCAHLVQRPNEKPRVAIVLRGLKGTGKDVFIEYLKTLLHPVHWAHFDRSDELVARFNSSLELALLAHVEEAFFPGDPTMDGPLKALITEPTKEIERKGLEKYKALSYTRVVMSTNELWTVRATPDERRYAVFDVSVRHRNDADYFGPLVKEMQGEGPGQLLWWLLQRDISEWNPLKVPQTAALMDQKVKGLTGTAAWLYQLLDSGERWEDDPVSRATVFADYTEWGKRTSFHKLVDEATFGRELRALIDVKDIRPRGDGGRARMYVFPSLRDARVQFSSHMGGEIQWDDPGDTETG